MKKLDDLAGKDLRMSLLLIKAEAVKEPGKLLFGDRHGLLPICFGWPVKSTGIKPSVIKPETVLVPEEDLELVP